MERKKVIFDDNFTACEVIFDCTVANARLPAVYLCFVSDIYCADFKSLVQLELTGLFERQGNNSWIG